MSARGLVARGVPSLPGFLVYVVGLILLLSIVVLALAAYAEALSGHHYFYDSAVPAFLLFVSIWTWLVYGGMLVIEYRAPRFYCRIAVFIAQLLSAVFWITGWAWAASWASYILSFDNYSSHDRIRGYWKAFGQTTAACAAIGAFVWVLCIVALVAFYSACSRSPAPALANATELSHTSKPHVPQKQTLSSSSPKTTSQTVQGAEPSLLRPHNH
ncbi:hypothetical protein F4802DRAFT_544492 [Xylaria palmicola]|nr:hypothetical protein F4802DRAFT_544492 [Xylaria palmicola]